MTAPLVQWTPTRPEVYRLLDAAVRNDQAAFDVELAGAVDERRLMIACVLTAAQALARVDPRVPAKIAQLANPRKKGGRRGHR